MQLFLLFNHSLTPEQESDARGTLGIRAFVALPPELQALWSNVPPELPHLSDYLAPLLAWLDTQARIGDYVLVQGDYGATHLAVLHCTARGYVAVHGTTARQVVEHPQPDGSIRIERVFRHARFRAY